MWLSHVNTEGQPLTQPVRVNAKAGEATAWHGDPPTLALAPDNTIYVIWTARGGEGTRQHALSLRLARRRANVRRLRL